jgi:hypothetical protein
MNIVCGEPFIPLEGISFPTLWDLSLSPTEEDSRFLGLEFATASLTSLYVDSGIIETAAVHGVADSQLVKALSPDSEPNDDNERYKIIFDHHKPVFKLGNLKSLQVSHLYPLVKIEDIG